MVTLLRLASLLAAAGIASTVQAELKLTPTISEYELDGVKLQQLAFSDDGRTVTYQPPRGWSYSGDATQLRLHPKDKSQAEATITRIPRPRALALDEEGIKTLVAEALATIPQGSESVSVLSQEKNPIMIQRTETFLVTLRYTIYGQHYARSILFLYRGNEQIRAQLTCSEPDFSALQRAFFASHYTWQNL